MGRTYSIRSFLQRDMFISLSAENNHKVMHLENDLPVANVMFGDNLSR